LAHPGEINEFVWGSSAASGTCDTEKYLYLFLLISEALGFGACEIKFFTRIASSFEPRSNLVQAAMPKSAKKRKDKAADFSV
jgi:hypothetical protein